MQTATSEQIADKPDRGLALPNLRAAHRYLVAQGWRISERTIYLHRDEGKLRPRRDGAFTAAALDRYARRYLKYLDGKLSDFKEPEDSDLSFKQAAELRLRLAQAEIHEHKLKVLRGEYVPSISVESALAARASRFRSDLEHLCRSEAPTLVHLVTQGALSDDVAEFLLAKVADFLDSYAEPLAFEAPPPSPNGAGLE